MCWPTQRHNTNNLSQICSATSEQYSNEQEDDGSEGVLFYLRVPIARQWGQAELCGSHVNTWHPLLELETGGYHQVVGDDQTNQQQQYCNTPHPYTASQDHRQAENNQQQPSNVLILDLSSPLGDLLSNISPLS